jgi:hypothetical protein
MIGINKTCLQVPDNIKVALKNMCPQSWDFGLSDDAAKWLKNCLYRELRLEQKVC